ncbi:hypothetical protein KXV52_005664 [Aspergillus fumigatus]|nr:hypothetical protein KXV66_004226 [Aspergillus fumigatus]KAH3359280.1 hypothetical protein KXV52_005664 [Aspergillus fumigatus]
MVFSAPAPGVGSSKRPASCMQDDVSDRDNEPSMGLSVRSSINIPYVHYAMIYLDNMGRLKVMESPSIQEQDETVFTTERARNSPANSKYGVPPSVQFSLTVEETPSYGSVDIVGLKIGDTPKVLEYYERSLKHFRQFNCREVAKAFIKFIEPGKQVKHPYNGGKPPAGAPPGNKGDPEKIKPEWWPADVVHKEPDHLRRNYLERLSLLIHIIRKLGRVRRIEERYERGEVGANKIVYVVNRESNQKEKDNDSNVDPDQKHEQEDDNAREALPILYSEKNSTSPMSNLAEHTGMTAPRRPMNMEDCRNRLFPLPEWLSFSETPGDD